MVVPSLSATGLQKQLVSAARPEVDLGEYGLEEPRPPPFLEPFRLRPGGEHDFARGVEDVDYPDARAVVAHVAVSRSARR